MPIAPSSKLLGERKLSIEETMKLVERTELSNEAKKLLERGKRGNQKEPGQGYLFYVHIVEEKGVKKSILDVIPAVNAVSLEKKDKDEKALSASPLGQEQIDDIQKKMDSLKKKVMGLNIQIEKNRDNKEKSDEVKAWLEETATLELEKENLKAQLEKKPVKKLSSTVNPKIYDINGQAFEKVVYGANPVSASTGSAGGTGGRMHNDGQRLLNLEDKNILFAGGVWLDGEIRTRATKNMLNIKRNPLFMLYFADSMPTQGDAVGHSQVLAREIPYPHVLPIISLLYKSVNNAPLLLKYLETTNSDSPLPKSTREHILVEKSWLNENIQKNWLKQKLVKLTDQGVFIKKENIQEIVNALNDPDFKQENMVLREFALGLALDAKNIEVVNKFLEGLSQHEKSQMNENLLKKLSNLEKDYNNQLKQDISFNYSNDPDFLFKLTKQAHIGRVRNLLDNKVDPNRSTTGETPLSIAIANKDAEMVELLLQKGADPNLKVSVSAIAGLMVSPLYLAIKNKDAKTVDLLLKYNANPNISGMDTSPLHLAIRMGEPRIVKQLLANKETKLNLIRDEITPIQLAMNMRNKEMVELLSADSRVKADAKTQGAILAIQMNMDDPSLDELKKKLNESHNNPEKFLGFITFYIPEIKNLASIAQLIKAINLNDGEQKKWVLNTKSHSSDSLWSSYLTLVKDQTQKIIKEGNMSDKTVSPEEADLLKETIALSRTNIPSLFSKPGEKLLKMLNQSINISDKVGQSINSSRKKT
jgi:ankyrin repeat protein